MGEKMPENIPVLPSDHHSSDESWVGGTASEAVLTRSIGCRRHWFRKSRNGGIWVHVTGVLSVRRRDFRQQSTVSGYNIDHRHDWTDDLFWRGKPWATQNAVRAGRVQTAEETGSVQGSWGVLASLLVGQNARNQRRRGDVSINWFLLFVYFYHW